MKKVDVSPDYIQQVNTSLLVLELRAAVDKALASGMQFGTAIGTLRMMEREIEDLAISNLQEVV